MLGAQYQLFIKKLKKNVICGAEFANIVVLHSIFFMIFVSTIMIRSTTLPVAVLLLCTALFLLSCDRTRERETARSNDQPLPIQHREWVPEEGARILSLVDSMEHAGEISEIRAAFNRGVAYDMMRRFQVAEMYYRRAYESCNPTEDGWEAYLTIADKLSAIRMVSGDFEGSLTVASEAVDRAEKAGELTDSRKINLLWNISQCELQLGMYDEWEQLCAIVYDFLRQELRDNGWHTSSRLLIFTAATTSAYIDRSEYAKAAYWQTRSEEEMSLYDESQGRPGLLKDYSWRIAMNKVYIWRAEDKIKEAEKLYEETLPEMMESSDGMLKAAEYLMSVGRYAEAADMFDKVDALVPDLSQYPSMNLSNLKESLIPRLRANLEAGRTAEVVKLARLFCSSFDSALEVQRQDNAAELATIYATHLKDEQIAAQQAEMSRLRIFWLVAVLVLISLFFYIYDRGHRQHLKMLSSEHRKLEEAYGDLALANLRVEESSRMKSHFIQQISHEIRTPLNILSGFSQILTASGMELGADERDEINRGILENTGRITSLVNKMLDLSDAVSERASVPPEFVTAGQIANAAVRESGITSAQHLNFMMMADDAVSDKSLKTNLAQASHALAMLLDNAQKFTHPAVFKGEQYDESRREYARLQVSELEGRIAFVVEDTGIGVPPKEVEHIFEEFVQLDDYYVGTGIGLTVARSLARRLGGDIVLDTSYTGGARFVMTLPIDKEK